ncbi:MAG TPA: TonB-dependent receptor [Rhizomicrobium sp.]
MFAPALAARAADVETVVVTASALPGTAIDPDRIPASVQTFSEEDLSRLGAVSALRTLNSSGAGVSLADAQDNPLQPNLYYRGFEASPLAGDAQGLAVYVDGVRFNQPFGDVVNWDLIADIAIDRLTLEGTNPVFGLNALGGAISVQMKNGFLWQGTQAEVQGGSFGRAQGSLQAGGSAGDGSVYVAASALNDDGWRDHSPSRVAQAFADFGWRSRGVELHLDVIGAATGLTGNGPVPVQLLAVDRSGVFTFPDKTDNRYGLANLFGTTELSRSLSLQGNIYVGRFRQMTRNGDASNVEGCDTGLLCLDNGTVLTDTSGRTIPDFLAGGTYAQLNSTATGTLGFGGSLQLSNKGALFDHANHLIVGAVYDGGRTDFSARTDLGELSPHQGFLGPGIIIDLANGEIAPVQITSGNDDYGLYAADIFSITHALSLSVSARFNAVRVALRDRLGTSLNGSHSFTHVNPAAGLTYRISQAATLYAGYAEANRAPTPAELSCASAAAPCSLTNFFVADPPLRQVIAQTFEAGGRGEFRDGETSLRWQAGVFRADAADDILFAASPMIGRGFFRNVGGTRRQGLELSADLSWEAWSGSLAYSYTAATFRSALTLNSPENPRADDNGEIHVRPGDALPSIPKNTLKATINYQPDEAFGAYISGRYAGGQYLRGDEANLNPTTPPYVVFGVGARYRFSPHFELFTEIANVFDAHYATFGTFSPVSDVPIAEVPNASNPRSLSPGAPGSLYVGIRATT